MRIFTNYTNKWKASQAETKKHISSAKSLSIKELRDEFRSLKTAAVKSGAKGRQYKPVLPKPKNKENTVTIRYVKDRDLVTEVDTYLHGYANCTPSVIGEECFDLILERAQNT